MKQLLSFLVLISAFSSYSQGTFENGYFINNSGERIACLIKGMDWKNNPTEIRYKLSEAAQFQKLTIESVKEFGVTGVSKYERVLVGIDRSGESVSELTTNRNPEFKEEHLFLKVLVDGKASLYLYEDESLKRFFYRKENASTEQLIFKSYRSSENYISKNYTFRQQLMNDLACQTIDSKEIENVNYRRNELINLFIKYNKCADSRFVNFDDYVKRRLVHLTMRPRINYSSLTLVNSNTSFLSTNFSYKLTGGIGAEAEFSLPSNNYQWSITIEPTFQYYKSEKTTESNSVSGGQVIAMVNYKSIEVPVGLRRYFFVNDKSKIYVNAGFIYDVPINSWVEFNRANGSSINLTRIKGQINFAAGIGYKWNRYSLEFRYQSPRRVFTNLTFWSSDYQTNSLILGYSVF